MRSETIDSTFGESFSAGLAGVLVAVAGVVEFCATSEVLKNQSCRNVLALAFKRKTDAILLTRRLVLRCTRTRHNFGDNVFNTPRHPIRQQMNTRSNLMP